MIVKYINKIIYFFLKKNNIFIIYRTGSAIGDQLLLTGVISLIKKKYKFKVILFISYVEFFINNPNVYKLYKYSKNRIICKIFYKIFNKLNNDRIKEFAYISNNANSEKIFDLQNFQNIHLAEYHSKNLNLNLDFADFNNEIYFSKNEIDDLNKKFRLPKNFSLIQSQGKTTFTKNKEWGPLKFQKIIDKITDTNWIQIGLNTDHKLANTLFFYNNLSIRELCFVIYKCDFLVCLEGLYNHIANCFKKKTFLILSGFLNEKNITYKNNIIIKNFDNLKCYPCYKIYDCDIPGKPCTNQILESDLIKKINSKTI